MRPSNGLNGAKKSWFGLDICSWSDWQTRFSKEQQDLQIRFSVFFGRRLFKASLRHARIGIHTFLLMVQRIIIVRKWFEQQLISDKGSNMLKVEVKKSRGVRRTFQKGRIPISNPGLSRNGRSRRFKVQLYSHFYKGISCQLRKQLRFSEVFDSFMDNNH